MRPLSLMVVDDSTIIRNKIQRVLVQHPLQVVATARNGAEAVALCAQHKPDVVTMDLTMPEMDGVACIPKLLALRPDILILVVSALTDKATAIRALQRGARGFLPKPFTEQQLAESLDELLRGAGRGRS